MQKRRYADAAMTNTGPLEDVAEAIAHLAGPRSAYVAGINLLVAGVVLYGILYLEIHLHAA